MQTAGEHAGSRPLPPPERSPSAGDIRPSSAHGAAGARDQANVTKPRTSLGLILFSVGFAKAAFLADQWLIRTAVAALLAVVIGTAVFVGLNRQTAPVAEPPPDVAPQAAAEVAAGDTRVGPLYPPTAPPPRAPQTQNSRAALEAASRFITSGHVQAARTELLQVAQEGSADVAWAIARSYDPNFLGTLSAADAGPDVAEATRWYRTWYDIAVKQGLVADSVSLDRIIRSMH
jgi:hypothetical protein